MLVVAAGAALPACPGSFAITNGSTPSFLCATILDSNYPHQTMLAPGRLCSKTSTRAAISRRIRIQSEHRGEIIDKGESSSITNNCVWRWFGFRRIPRVCLTNGAAVSEVLFPYLGSLRYAIPTGVLTILSFAGLAILFRKTDARPWMLASCCCSIRWSIMSCNLTRAIAIHLLGDNPAGGLCVMPNSELAPKGAPTVRERREATGRDGPRIE